MRCRERVAASFTAGGSEATFEADPAVRAEQERHASSLAAVFSSHMCQVKTKFIKKMQNEICTVHMLLEQLKKRS